MSKVGRWLPLVVFSGWWMTTWMIGCFFQEPNLTGFVCTKTEECLGSLECVDGRCRIPCAQNQDCKDTSNCVNGFCALSVGDAGPTDICLKKQEVCNNLDDDCDGQIDEDLRCAKEGDVCDLALDKPIQCMDGLRCISFSPDRPRVCRRECDASNLSSCSDDKLICLRIAGTGACYRKDCKTDADCSLYRTPHVCVSTGGSNRFCLAVFKEGTLNPGEVCNPDKGLLCKVQTSCMRNSKEAKGLCSIRCGSDSDCKPDDQNRPRVCRILEGNYRICRHSCDSGSNNCPTGTTCDTTSKLCKPN